MPTTQSKLHDVDYIQQELILNIKTSGFFSALAHEATVSNGEIVFIYINFQTFSMNFRTTLIGMCKDDVSVKYYLNTFILPFNIYFRRYRFISFIQREKTVIREKQPVSSKVLEDLNFLNRPCSSSSFNKTIYIYHTTTTMVCQWYCENMQQFHLL